MHHHRTPSLRALWIVVGSLLFAACQTTPDRTTAAGDSIAISISPAFSAPKSIDSMTRAERQAFVAVLQDSGVYRCCTDPACTSCLYEDDPRCRCGDAVREKDPVCGECYRGWKRGRGSVPGVDVASLKRR